MEIVERVAGANSPFQRISSNINIDFFSIDWLLLPLNPVASDFNL
jgi:hypothetical protein